MKISLVINCDSRPQNDSAETMFNGTVNQDYLLDGVLNKVKFLEGFDKEVIVHIDKHNDIPEEILMKLQEVVDVLVVRKHTHENGFNDWNYLRAISLATGDIIMHFDQDTAVFVSSQKAMSNFIDLCYYYNFVSYPSYWSPYPVHDESFDHTWVSTRFFMCERRHLDLSEIARCQADYDYWCEKYPVVRKCHWTEHLIGSIAKHRGQSVYYPPMNTNEITIFSWGKYQTGVLKELNNMGYDGIKNWLSNHPIVYPNDIHL